MNVDQIWQQLDLRAARVSENLQTLLGEDECEDKNAYLDGEGSDDDDDGSEDEDEDEDEEDTEEMDVDEDESIWEELDDGGDGSSAAEGLVNLRDEISEDDEDPGPPISMLDVVRGQKLGPPGPYSGGHPELDDGFFDLAAFNAETSKPQTKEVHKRKHNFVADEDSTEESEVDLFGSIDDSVTEGVGDGPGE